MENKNPNILSKMINEFVDGGNISYYFFHRNYEDGSLELNITFKDGNISNNVKEKYDVEEIDSCAYWE